MRAYAIGDIHGRLSLLEAAHDLIAADMAREGHASVIHVGDLVDRGENSRGVIEFLMEGQARGADWAVLKGNHDRMFTRFLQDPAESEPGLRAELSWLHPRLGGGRRFPLTGCMRRVIGLWLRCMPMLWRLCRRRIATGWKHGPRSFGWDAVFMSMRASAPAWPLRIRPRPIWSGSASLS